METTPGKTVRFAFAGLVATGLALVCLAVPASARALNSTSGPVAALGSTGPGTSLNAADWSPAALGTLAPDVFALAMTAASCAVHTGAAAAPTTLSVIDYSKPSTSQRLWVFDLVDRSLLYQELVAHGQGSGDNTPTEFSNDAETHRSSIGLFLTAEPYIGKNGYSLRLDGLEPGFNDHARERDIVIHGASYVSEDFAASVGRLGRSWGCPALRPAIARELIDKVKGGNLLFSYYPDQKWLAQSKYLHGC
jgi:hypothetical protein